MPRRSLGCNNCRAVDSACVVSHRNWRTTMLVAVMSALTLPGVATALGSVSACQRPASSPADSATNPTRPTPQTPQTHASVCTPELASMARNDGRRRAAVERRKVHPGAIASGSQPPVRRALSRASSTIPPTGHHGPSSNVVTCTCTRVLRKSAPRSYRAHPPQPGHNHATHAMDIDGSNPV